MDSVNTGNDTIEEEQSSFGIKKIVDCKIGDGGRQMYQVKWEPTWEPAENLASCQHLIDQFWSFVNKAKTNEDVALQHRKRTRLDEVHMMNVEQNFDRLSEDSKMNVQRLISRANSTSAGAPLLSPSNMLSSPQRNPQTLSMARTPTHADNQNFPHSPQTPSNMRQVNPLQMHGLGQKSLNFGSNQHVESSLQKSEVKAKMESDDTSNSKVGDKTINNTGLKYLENFNNPYVKILVACKICNKEQSLKYPNTWKRHYSFHMDGPKFPCTVCGKSFKQQSDLKRHEKNIHFKSEGGTTIKSDVKSELFY